MGSTQLVTLASKVSAFFQPGLTRSTETSAPTGSSLSVRTNTPPAEMFSTTAGVRPCCPRT